MSATTASSAASATASGTTGSALSQKVSVVSLLTAIGSAVAIFAIQIGAFEILRNKLGRIYIPKTYLVPEREQTHPPPRTFLTWVKSIFTYRDREIISKCGLDAYFFLRYLQTLLIIFVPLACLILPILLPINYVHGRGSDFAANLNTTSQASGSNVTGLDTVAWGNVPPDKTHRYWAHLILAVVVVAWVCYVSFAELRVYIRIRQDYLTSAEHRLKASATTVLVSSIPRKWLTEKALMGLYDVFPGGIRNIWMNRNYDQLLNKVHLRQQILHKLEHAETELIRKCKKAQLKQAKKDEKKMAKTAGTKDLTKEEKQQRQRLADEEANRMAQGEGFSSGDPHQVRRTVDDAVEEEEARPNEPESDRGRFKIPVFGTVGQGLGRGLGALGGQIGKAGQTIVGGARAVGKDIDGQITTTNGFVPIDSPPTPALARFESNTPRPSGLRTMNTFPEDEGSQVQGRPTNMRNNAMDGAGIDHSAPAPMADASRQFSHNRDSSQSTLGRTAPRFDMDGTNEGDNSSDNWLRFWRGPSVGYPSPNPHGFGEGDEFPIDSKIPQVDGPPTPRGRVHNGSLAKRQERPTTMDKIKQGLQALFALGHNDQAAVEYPEYYNKDYKEDVPGGAIWEKYIDISDRPTHRTARFSFIPDFLPTLPLISPKVDSIYWCREELARLNVEIEEDQRHPERYPLMNSAFIQFNHQVAAHMASQAVSHHMPKQMAPRSVEVSPTDVIWDNMSIRWWEAWFRKFVVLCIVTAMTILWAIPVGGTALLGNLPKLIEQVPWLSFLNDNDVVRNVFTALGGVLPALSLAILLALVPKIFYFLAGKQGVQTGMMRELTVQNYLFFFNFVQIFLVVSITSGALNSLAAHAADVTSIPDILAKNLPLAANYFFSYMILQALGNSSGALLQYGTLILWFVLPKLFDNTARDKWRRNTSLSVVNWGSYFPLYTTFACIALVYSVIAPLILIFAIITFSLYWVANRYCMLYIFKVKEDTGGLLYPHAINQTFTGLYVMEICMIGLFFLVRDQNGDVACTPQGIVMIVVTACTLLFQFLLNQSFGPLYRHLPITLEDDAVLRDEAFERAQAARFEREENEDEEEEDRDRYAYPDEQQRGRKDEDIEMRKLSHSVSNPDGRTYRRYDPRKGIAGATSWAVRGTAAIRTKALGRSDSNVISDPTINRRRRHRDLEAQKRIGAALFGNMDDEIEDLTPDERDMLVNRAFKHEALRARRPTVWIPRDDLGISDEEIRRTSQFSNENIWISNDGTALDGKVRVLYGKNPPDFTKVDLIKL